MTFRQKISDESWAVLEPLFPVWKGNGRPILDMRRTLEGNAWRSRTGAPRRDVPERFGNWNSICGRFSDWSKDGTWSRVLATVQGARRRAGDLAWTVSVDSTITRVHQHGASLPRDTGGSDRLPQGSADRTRRTAALARNNAPIIDHRRFRNDSRAPDNSDADPGPTLIRPAQAQPSAAD